MTHGLPFGGHTYLLPPQKKLFEKHQKHIEMKRGVGRQLFSKPWTIPYYGQNLHFDIFSTQIKLLPSSKPPTSLLLSSTFQELLKIYQKYPPHALIGSYKSLVWSLIKERTWPIGMKFPNSSQVAPQRISENGLKKWQCQSFQALFWGSTWKCKI